MKAIIIYWFSYLPVTFSSHAPGSCFCTMPPTLSFTRQSTVCCRQIFRVVLLYISSTLNLVFQEFLPLVRASAEISADFDSLPHYLPHIFHIISLAVFQSAVHTVYYIVFQNVLCIIILAVFKEVFYTIF